MICERMIVAGAAYRNVKTDLVRVVVKIDGIMVFYRTKGVFTFAPLSVSIKEFADWADYREDKPAQ